MEIGGDQTLFIYWLKHLPWDDEQRARLQQTLWQYCVGGWKDGRVVFWQIDHNGIPRAAKLMRYLPDGHRDKTQHPGWIYNQDGCRQALDPDNHEIIKPLFGSHLLSSHPKAAVNIVESEKTAIIMANYYGDPDTQLWLACGGLKHLQLDSLQPLIDQGRTIWLWPDKDGREAWQEVSDKLGYDLCRVYTHFFDTCWTEEDGDKADVADIAIRMMRTGDKPRKEEPKQEPVKIGNIITEIWHSDEPFLDPVELRDPRVREWRETLRRAYPGKKHRPIPPTSNIGGVKTVGEIISENPLINQLIEIDNDRRTE